MFSTDNAMNILCPIGAFATYLGNLCSSITLTCRRKTMKHGFKMVEIDSSIQDQKEKLEARPLWAQTALFVVGALPYGVSGYYGGAALGGFLLGAFFAILNGCMNGYQFATLPGKSKTETAFATTLGIFISWGTLYLSKGVQTLDPDYLANYGAAIVTFFMASGVIKNTSNILKMIFSHFDKNPELNEANKINCKKTLRKIIARVLAGGLGYPLAADNLAASKNPHNLFAQLAIKIYGEKIFSSRPIQLAGSTTLSGFAYGHIADDTIDYLFVPDKRGPLNAPNALSWLVGTFFIAASIGASAIATVENDPSIQELLLTFLVGFVGSFFTNFASAKDIAESLIMGISRMSPCIKEIEDSAFRTATPTRAAALHLEDPTATTPLIGNQG